MWKKRSLRKQLGKANPFGASRPIRDPQNFFGRAPELREFFQAVARSQSVIVTGERGIGKSSFVSQLEEYLRGNKEAARKYASLVGPEPMRMAVVRVRCQPGITRTEFMGGLVANLRRDYANRSWLRMASVAWKTAMRGIEILLGGIVLSPHSDRPPTVEEADQNGFCAYVAHFLKWEARFGGVKGVVFIADEVEDAMDYINFGAFARSTVEALDPEFPHVCFVISGADGTAARIFDDNPGAMRFFQHIPLVGMPDAELAEIVTAHLSQMGVRVAASALRRMVALANQSPSRLQMIAHECFEADTDGEITLEDVTAAAAAMMKRFQVQLFGKFARSENWEDYRAILRCISAHEPDSMTADEIARCTGLPAKRTQALCGHLNAGGVLIGPSTRRGRSEKTTYRMRNQVAALYFRLAEELDRD
jgi:hypothetical protein